MHKLLILLTREINGDDKRATLCPRFCHEYRISGHDIRGSDVTSGIAKKKKKTVKKKEYNVWNALKSNLYMFAPLEANNFQRVVKLRTLICLCDIRKEVMVYH